MIYYHQCSLKLSEADKITETVTYLPAIHAKVGKKLRLKSEGVWTKGWIVQTVHPDAVPENMLPNSHRDIKGHRKSTGDNMPKKSTS